MNWILIANTTATDFSNLVLELKIAGVLIFIFFIFYRLLISDFLREDKRK